MKSNIIACGTALALSCVFVSAGCSGGESAAPSAVAEPVWTEDPRLIDLFTHCTTLGHFSGDTSDIVPVLVDKLTTGQLDVLRSVRAELAQLGDAAVPELDALLRRSYSERFGTPAVRNVLGVLRLSQASSAHDILRRCLEHPNDEVRSEAAAALVGHARPEDYEPLASLLPVSGPTTRSILLNAMYAADPERVAVDLARWLAEDSHQDLHVNAARGAAKSAGARAHELYGERIEDVHDAALRAYLLAALVNAGDESALAELRAMLGADPDPFQIPDRGLTTVALEAVELTGRIEEVLPVLAGPDPVLRARAVSLLKPVAAEPWARAALSARLQDEHGEVRQVVLDALLSIGDEAAGDVAISLLAGGAAQLTLALMVLRPNWEAQPGLAARAFELLRVREAEVAGGTLAGREQLLRALGQVPSAEAAELLLTRARELADQEIHRMSAHRWLAREVGNTAPGREVLRAAWQREVGEVRRMDLLEGASFGRDDPTREFLLEVVQSDHAGAWERLYAAERLARQGPSSEIAPVLKRVALRCDHREVRPALDCLLWRWYGRAQAGG